MRPATLLRRLRAAATPARAQPAWGAGLRATVATAAPLLVGYALGVPEMSWASLAGFQVSLADKGGAYRARAATMVTLIVASAFSAAVAAVAGHDVRTAVPLMLVWGVACGLARVFGAGAASIGVAAAVGFVISLASPATPELALQRAGMMALGGAWATLLSLLLWPVRPYRPAQRQVALCYRLLAEYATVAERLLRGGTKRAWRGLFQAEPARIRDAIDTARATLGWARRGRAGESARGEQLLVLVEAADQLFAYLLALADVLSTSPPTARPGGSRTRSVSWRSSPKPRARWRRPRSAPPAQPRDTPPRHTPPRTSPLNRASAPPPTSLPSSSATCASTRRWPRKRCSAWRAAARARARRARSHNRASHGRSAHARRWRRCAKA